MSEDDALLSRSAVSALGLKLDDTIDAFRIDSETKTKLQQDAAVVGMTLTEYARLRLQGAAWGEERVERMTAERIRRALGKVS